MLQFKKCFTSIPPESVPFFWAMNAYLQLFSSQVFHCCLDQTPVENYKEYAVCRQSSQNRLVFKIIIIPLLFFFYEFRGSFQRRNLYSVVVVLSVRLHSYECQKQSLLKLLDNQKIMSTIEQPPTICTPLSRKMLNNHIPTIWTTNTDPGSEQVTLVFQRIVKTNR